MIAQNPTPDDERANFEICFRDRYGMLIVTCEIESFERFRDIILSDSRLAEVIGDDKSKVKLIQISMKPPPTRWLRDRVTLLGCLLIGFAIMFVLVAGVMAITGWLK